MQTASGSKIKRFLYMCVGNVLLGIGVAVLRLAGFGTDPFSCMNIGVSSHLPISYGTYQLLVNLVLFIPVLCFDRKSFGAGAFVNMVGLGYIVDFCVWLFAGLGITIEGMQGLIAVRIFLLPVGIVLICLGIALYMECDLGIAPYDVIAQIVEDRTKGKLKFKWVRVGMDFFSTAVGYVSGGVVGVATVVVAFFTGPLVSWFRSHVAAKLLNSDAG